MRIYIIGNNAEALAKKLYEDGHIPVFCEGSVAEKIKKIVECDAIAFLPGFENDNFTKIAILVGKAVGLNYYNIEHYKSKINVNLILNEVLLEYRIGMDELVSDCRKQEICDARKIAAKIIRENIKLSLSHIGNILARDHATILLSIKNANMLLDVDRKFSEHYNAVNSRVLNTLL
jgi:chromosomal replication initiation ATPase DnaA